MEAFQRRRHSFFLSYINGGGNENVWIDCGGRAEHSTSNSVTQKTFFKIAPNEFCGPWRGQEPWTAIISRSGGVNHIKVILNQIKVDILSVSWNHRKGSTFWILHKNAKYRIYRYLAFSCLFIWLGLYLRVFQFLTCPELQDFCVIPTEG